MAEIKKLSAYTRPGTGTGAARAVRRDGKIPGILYGGEKANEPIAVDAKQLTGLVNTGRFTSMLVVLDLEGREQRVLPREVQLDPVTDRPIHADFMRLEEGAVVRLKVPVRFKGHDVSPGLKRGGVLNVVRHEVEFFCPADNIPEFIEGDLSKMEINESMHISAFALPEGVTPVIQSRDFTIATIAPPSGYAEEKRAEAAAAAAPAAAAPAAGDKKAAPAKK
ncbi:MAG: 50S ribosomal protein L25/general stress protein Ctc [Alphaproteobacteria bacterium]|nr:50S ribosomal protein L25/general stress protein Ctc [Alphaproteobacteria bacterium]